MYSPTRAASESVRISEELQIPVRTGWTPFAGVPRHGEHSAEREGGAQSPDEMPCRRCANRGPGTDRPMLPSPMRAEA